MREYTYKDNEKVLHNTRCKLSLPNKEPEEADCFVTEGHVIIEAEEPVKIPVSRIKGCEISHQAISLAYPYIRGAKNEPLFDILSLTFFDDLHEKHELLLELSPMDTGYFQHSIELVKKYPNGIPPLTDIEKLFERLKNIGLQAEAIDNLTVKLTGQNIDEIQLCYRSRGGGPGEIPITELFLAYIVKPEALQSSRNLTADIEEYEDWQHVYDNAGTKWSGGELAFHLNEDTELDKLLLGAGKTGIHIRAKKRQKHVEITERLEDFSHLTRESLEAYNRIAKHVREVATEAVTTGGVIREKRKVKVIRGSILRSAVNAAKWGSLAGIFFGIIIIIFAAVKRELSITTFMVAGFLIPFGAISVGLWEFLRLSIKRLRGRF